MRGRTPGPPTIGGAEIIGGVLHGVLTGWQLPLVSIDSRRGAELERALVDKPAARGEVWMLPGGERAGPIADVGRRGGDLQAIVTERVRDLDVDRERVALHR